MCHAITLGAVVSVENIHAYMLFALFFCRAIACSARIASDREKLSLHMWAED